MLRTRLNAARAPLAVLALALMLALAGCAGSPSPLSPTGTNAQLISQLSVIILAISGVVFVVVEALLVYAAIRYSRNRGEGLPRQVEGNTKLEVGWTLIPAVILLIVFVLSIQTLQAVGYRPQAAAGGVTSSSGAVPPAGMNVKVIGHRWFWEFQYPDLQIVTANELHLPEGVTANITVQSIDVIHSFWVPQLAGKIDAVPGHDNHTWLEATQLGTFHGQCAEFCGAQHAGMRFEVVVETPDQFQAWVAQQQQPAAAPADKAAQGQQIFLSSACVGCHTINGTKAQGKVGPNLTHFASRLTFAGASYSNTPENLARWLANPQELKPGNLMPNLHLTPDQIDNLTAFLESLK